MDVYIVRATRFITQPEITMERFTYYTTTQLALATDITRQVENLNRLRKVTIDISDDADIEKQIDGKRREYNACKEALKDDIDKFTGVTLAYIDEALWAGFSRDERHNNPFASNNYSLNYVILTLDADFCALYLRNDFNVVDAKLKTVTDNALFCTYDLPPVERSQIVAAVTRYIDNGPAKRAADIRHNWSEALSRPEETICHDIRYSLFKKDLIELGRLYKNNVYRSKIEQLLDDCKCHTERAFLSDSDYNGYYECIEAGNIA